MAVFQVHHSGAEYWRRYMLKFESAMKIGNLMADCGFASSLKNLERKNEQAANEDSLGRTLKYYRTRGIFFSIFSHAGNFKLSVSESLPRKKTENSESCGRQRTAVNVNGLNGTLGPGEKQNKEADGKNGLSLRLGGPVGDGPRFWNLKTQRIIPASDIERGPDAAW
ncbi:hypothetical protein K438DRAFT_1759578 [Mycena galopus ATCC 62051]|nr:hypothetical protein K438DRAFT_1759578 [Mycena galopus ATCC 62051]